MVDMVKMKSRSLLWTTLALSLLVPATAAKTSNGPKPSALECTVFIQNGGLIPETRFIEVNVASRYVVDRTVLDAPVLFQITKQNPLWIVATANKQTFLKSYLSSGHHQIGSARLSLNRISMDVSLEVWHVPHTDKGYSDPNLRTPIHVASPVYSGRCIKKAMAF